MSILIIGIVIVEDGTDWNSAEYMKLFRWRKTHKLWLRKVVSVLSFKIIKMTFLEFVVSKIFGPIMTNLICMPYYRPWFEDLSDVQSFDLSHARNLRIPVLNNAQNAAESVIFSIILRLIASNLYTLSNLFVSCCLNLYVQ